VKRLKLSEVTPAKPPPSADDGREPETVVYLLQGWRCEIEIRQYGREPKLILRGSLINPPAGIEPALAEKWRR
jgi:hypothetical protein